MRVPPLWLASSTEWLLGARCALGVVLSDPRGHRGWHGQASILLNLEVISADGGDALCELAALHDHVVLSRPVAAAAAAMASAPGTRRRASRVYGQPLPRPEDGYESSPGRLCASSWTSTPHW